MADGMNELQLTRIELAIARELRKGDALTFRQIALAVRFSDRAITEALGTLILRGMVGSRYIDGDKNEEFYARPQ